jgi:AcrR family transcriptional regulator
MMDDANTENAESAAEGGIPQPKASRPSGSRLVWLNGAFALLKSGGIDAVKIMPLAKGLNLTRTGFYWHFKDLNALHEAMIERWASLSTAGYIQQCAREARTISHALFHMMDCWIDPGLFDPQRCAIGRAAMPDCACSLLRPIEHAPRQWPTFLSALGMRPIKPERVDARLCMRNWAIKR